MRAPHPAISRQIATKIGHHSEDHICHITLGPKNGIRPFFGRNPGSPKGPNKAQLRPKKGQKKTLICRVVDHARRSAHSADDELFARPQAALTSEPVSPLQHWLNDSITSSHLYLIWFGLSRARSHGSKLSARLAPLGSPLPTRTQLRATVVYFAPHEAHMHVAIMCARSSPKLIPA